MQEPYFFLLIAYKFRHCKLTLQNNVSQLANVTQTGAVMELDVHGSLLDSTEDI